MTRGRSDRLLDVDEKLHCLEEQHVEEDRGEPKFFIAFPSALGHLIWTAIALDH